MKIAQNTVVTLDYILRVEASVVETTEGDEPMTYLHGHENIVPGLEKALVGLVVGDTKRVLVQAKDGYGEYDEDGVQNLAKTNFEEALEVGETYFGETEEGEPISFSVLEEIETEYVVDFNHALAGEILEFEVTVRGVREATKSELEHGHVHGGEGHEHVN
jgi:FKBP-type peptidyl-prolyl cis-trans isomerase SlyD